MAVDSLEKRIKAKYGVDIKKILKARNQGMKDAEIAAKLGITTSTLETIEQEVRHEDWETRSQRIKQRMGLL